MHLDQFLHRHGIALVRQPHPAVMTCAQADLLVPKLHGAKAKNLFPRLLAATGHCARVVDVPVRTAPEAVA